MRIPCPHCGPRPHDEYVYHGDGSLERPAAGVDAGDPAWHDYVYLRENRAGPTLELWYHGVGCRSWLRVTRDTRTHAIQAVELARP